MPFKEIEPDWPLERAMRGPHRGPYGHLVVNLQVFLLVVGSHGGGHMGPYSVGRHTLVGQTKSSQPSGTDFWRRWSRQTMDVVVDRCGHEIGRPNCALMDAAASEPHTNGSPKSHKGTESSIVMRRETRRDKSNDRRHLCCESL